MKQEYDREDMFDQEMGMSDKSNGTFEKEYDTIDELDGDFQGSGNLEGSLHLRVSLNISSNGSKDVGRTFNPNLLKFFHGQ